MMRVLLGLVVGASLAAAPVARAQSGGVHQHDGFFLQMNLGLGSMDSKASQNGSSAELSGGAGQFSIAIGGAPVENFIIAGELFGASVSSPTAKINGSSIPTASDASFGLSIIGLNFTYYFMPINIYLSATPGIGALTAKTSTSSSSTQNGFALKLAAGKEWWVSDNWGLGLNLQYAHSSNKDQGTNPPTWATNWFGVAFSATYN